MLKIVSSRLSTTVFIGLLIVNGCLSLSSSAIADGWHNPILNDKGFKEWAKDVAPILPTKGGKVDGKKDGKELLKNRTPPQINSQKLLQNEALLSRKGWDAVKILAHMEPSNIIDREFPKFDKTKIPQCRKDCKTFLMQLGPIGANVVVNQLVNTLMGMGGFESGIIISPDYERDMLEVLESHFAAGRVSANQVQSLLNACKGTKPDARTTSLANSVRESIDLTQIPIWTLVEMIKSAGGRKWRKQLFRELKDRMEDTPINEQISILRMPGLTPAITKLVLDSALDNMQTLSPPSRITLLTVPNLPPSSRRTLLHELKSPATLQPEHLNDLNQVLKLIDSPDSDVRAIARKNARELYLQAPVRVCITDSASADANGRKFMRNVVDQKVARANKKRKTKYKQTAKKFLSSSVANDAEKREAIYILKQLDCASVLVSVLINLEGELQKSCGNALNQMTGQTFGPTQQVSKLKLRAIQKKWSQWLENNPDFN